MTAIQKKKKQLEREAIKLWEEAALKKWGDKCLICNQPANAFHHFIPRSRSLVLKYDVENAVPLCQKHHQDIHNGADPAIKAEIIDIIKKKRGKKWVEYIEKKRQERTTESIKWLEEQISKLKQFLNYD